MIHSLSFSNISSFAEKNTINLTWDKKDSLDDTTILSPISWKRITKVLTVIWPNASWKSNLLRIFWFLRFWIVDSWNLPPDFSLNNIGLLPNIFWAHKSQGSLIECVFETQLHLYTIEIIFKDWFAIDEKVYIHSKTKIRTTSKLIFSRHTLKKEQSTLLRNNASIIFTEDRSNNEIARDIINYWSNVFTRVSPIGTINAQNFEMLRWLVMSQYASNKEMLVFLNDMLKRFDTGFSELKIIPELSLDGKQNIKAIWIINNDSQEYEMQFFSEGTMKIIDYIPLIYLTLERWGVLVYDELDGSFHPEIVDAILELFLSEKYNKKNAQLIFTTHNPRILKKLNRYQIQLVEKDENSISHTFRLDEVEGVRIDDNYYAKYMAWAYWAVPDINI